MSTNNNGNNGAALKNDATQADVRGEKERAIVWTGLESATGQVRTLMLDGLKATAQHGATSADELGKYWPTCNNPGVYAPNFNRGNKAAAVIGIKATIDLIDRAAKLEGGAAFDKAKDALGAVIKEGKAREKAGKKLAASVADSKKICDAATSQAAKLLAERAAKKAAGKGPTTPVADTLLAAFADFDAIVARLGKLHAPEGREKALANAMNDLRKARENLVLCTK